MNNTQLLDVLTRQGVLISVNIRYWRARKKLTAQDIGIDPDDLTERLISLGHKRLLPKEALAPFGLIESRAHALVEAATFPFLGDIGRFLPNRKDLGNGKDGNNEKVGNKMYAVAAYVFGYRLFLLSTRAWYMRSRKPPCSRKSLSKRRSC